MSGGTRQTLENYFPFDPLHLRRSREWIEGIYCHWQGIPGMDDDDEDEDESDEDEDEEDDDESEDGSEDEDEEDED